LNIKEGLVTKSERTPDSFCRRVDDKLMKAMKMIVEK